MGAVRPLGAKIKKSDFVPEKRHTLNDDIEPITLAIAEHVVRYGMRVERNEAVTPYAMWAADERNFHWLDAADGWLHVAVSSEWGTMTPIYSHFKLFVGDDADIVAAVCQEHGPLSEPTSARQRLAALQKLTSVSQNMISGSNAN